MIIAAGAVLAATLYRAAPLLYLFQIKEYRRDRILSSIWEDGLLHHVYSAPFRWPSRSPRNLLIAAICLCLAALEAYLAISLPLTWNVALIFAGPFVALGMISFGAAVTAVYSNRKKAALLKRAGIRLRESGTAVIGITGSFGKTTTKEWLYELIRDAHDTVRTEGNQNTPYGIADNIIRQVSAGTKYFIAEIGSYRRGEIREICDVIQPRFGIVTPLGNQHLSLFGSRSNLEQAKRELLESLPATGHGYVNAKNAPVLSPGIAAHLSTYSLELAADITLRQTGKDAYIYTYTDRGVTFPFTSSIPKTYLANLLPATALALDLGIAPNIIRKKISSLTLPDDKLKVTVGTGGTSVILNTYSTNVDGFLAAISYLDARPEKNKIMVSRGIIELAGEKQKSYEDIGRSLKAGTCVLYTTDRAFTETAPRHVRMFAGERDLLDALRNAASPETAILLEGRFSQKFIQDLL